MPDVEISYKGSQIASMSASGVKTLLTGDSFCEDDIIVSYTKPSAPTPTLQSKTVSPSTSQQAITPDSGYDGLSQVTVNAMPSGSASTPATTITANPTISVSNSGLITASVSGSQSVTPTVSAGYVSSGTSGTVTVSGSNTQQLTTQGARTIMPNTTNQIIPSGKYLTGAQTIMGDVNLVAGNIKKNTSIFGVSGASTVVNVDSTTATESDVASGKVFFKADGSQATGTASGGGSQITKTTLNSNSISFGHAEIDITGFSLNDLLSIDNRFSSISYISATLSDDMREIILYPIHITLGTDTVVYGMFDEDIGDFLFLEIYIEAPNDIATIDMHVTSTLGDMYDIVDIALIIYKET